MNWYKTSQQRMLFYPWDKPSREVQQKADPIRSDGKTNYYKCGGCGEEIAEEDIVEWGDVPGIKRKYLYPMHLLNANVIKQELINLSNVLKQCEIDYQNPENKNVTETQISVEVTKKVVETINNSPNLLEYLKYRKSTSKPYSYVLGLTERIIQGEIITPYVLRQLDIIKDTPETLFSEIDKIAHSRGYFYIQVLVPFCEDCLDDIPQCEFCKKHIFDPTKTHRTIWSDDDYACGECVEKGDVDLCSECGRADYPDEMHYMEDIGSLCESCYEEHRSDYENLIPEIEELGEQNPRPFSNWFDEEERVFIPFLKNISSPDIRDEEVIEFLTSLGWEVSKENYRRGYAEKGGRTAKIGKLLRNLHKTELKSNDESKLPEINRKYNELTSIFMGSEYRKIKNTSNLVIVISQNPHDVAKMSTGRDWTSCMNISTGTRRDEIFCEVEEGGLIAYLTKKEDEDIEEPLARVLIRRFSSSKNKSIAMVENQVYGNAPGSFLEQVKDWVESKQGKIETGTYSMRGMNWSDSLEKKYEYAQKLLYLLLTKYSNSGYNWYKFARKFPSLNKKLK